MTSKENQHILDYVAARTTLRELRKIISRNKWALKAVERLWNKWSVDSGYLSAHAGKGCPHCNAVYDCRGCRWSLATNKMREGCCTVYFNNVSLHKIGYAGSVRVSLWWNRIEVAVSGNGPHSYNNAVAFLQGHVDWAQGEIDRRAKTGEKCKQ